MAPNRAWIAHLDMAAVASIPLVLRSKRLLSGCEHRGSSIVTLGPVNKHVANWEGSNFHAMGVAS